MKKISVILAVLLAFAVSCSAFAATVSLGSTGYYITLPSGYSEDQLTSDDIAEGMVSYWYNSSIELAVYVESDSYSVKDILKSYSSEDDCVDSGLIDERLAGLDFGYAVFQTEDGSDSYYTVCYFTTTGSDIIEFYFFVDDLSQASRANDIVATLSRGGTYGTSGNSGNYGTYGSSYCSSYGCSSVSIGNTGLVIDLTSDAEEQELTQEDIDDDVVGYWETDVLVLCAYVYESDWSDVFEIASDLSAEDGMVMTGVREMPSGIRFAYYAYREDGMTEVGYLTPSGSDVIQLSFYMDTSCEYEGSSQAKTIIESAR